MAQSPEGPTQLIYAEQQPVLVVREAVLRVVGGPDKGAACPLGLSRATVGTASDNDLVLSDPHVSRRHVELQVRDQGYLVRDLGSTNGTLFRGARVGEVLVDVGAEIRLGATTLRVERGEERSRVVGGEQAFGTLIGASAAMQEVYGLLATVATTDVTVLLEGETGTGKELVAEEIHRQSPRRGRSLCVIDCGALPPTLIESELFGHERGAFTGAVREREGLFEKARGGTVFLDEIGELPLELQSRLLRVLDRRTVKRVGGNLERRVDVRLVAATNRDLADEVQRGRFRQDLYYRLAVIRIVLPPLRQRLEDVPTLARHFLWEAGCPDPDAVLRPEVLQVLQSRQWPGNIRELRNIVERAMVMADEGVLREVPEQRTPRPTLEATTPSTPALRPRAVEEAASDAPDAPDAAGPPVAGPAEQGAAELEVGWLARGLPPGFLERPYKNAKELLDHQFETLYLRSLVQRFGQNISQMSRQAGVDRQVIRRLLHKHDLGPRE